MEIAIFWILFSIAVGVWASNKGRNGAAWCLLSLIVSPLVGLLFCAVVKDLSKQGGSDAVATSDTHVRCSACAEYVLPAASKCKHCGAQLVPQPNYAAERARQKDDLDWRARLITIGVVVTLSIVVWVAVGR